MPTIYKNKCNNKTYNREVYVSGLYVELMHIQHIDLVRNTYKQMGDAKLYNITSAEAESGQNNSLRRLESSIPFR